MMKLLKMLTEKSLCHLKEIQAKYGDDFLIYFTVQINLYLFLE